MMHIVFWSVQALITAAAAFNIWATDLVQKGSVTAPDALNFIVCLVMLYLLWSNWWAWKSRAQWRKNDSRLDDQTGNRT